MADKELGITVTGNLSDIEAKIQELTSLLNGVNDVNIGADADFEGIKGEIANLQDTLNTLDNEVITPEVSADGIADVSTEAESASGDMEDLGEAGEEAGSMIEGGMAIASLAVLALGADVEETAQKLGDLSVSYSKLGSSFEGGSAALRDQVANITDTEFPEDEALTYISLLKRMGVAQEDLVDSSDDLNKIRSATQSSVSDMTPLLQGLRSMNYDVSNLEGAYNALYFANAKYVGGLPAFSSDLRKYGSYFEDMGLNIDQAAVILVEAQKKWPDPRQMRTHLKEALDQSGGDVNKFADALGISNDKLKNAGNVTGEYAGKVESVSKQYEETATATQKLDAATADLGTRYGDLLQPLYDVAGGFATVTQKIGEAWLILKAGFKLGIFPEDYAAKYIEAPLKPVIDVLKNIGTKAKDVLKTVWGKLFGEAGTDVGGKLVTSIKNALPKSLDDLLSKIFKGGKGAGGGMLFTKEDFVGEPGSQKRTSWEEVFKGWGLSQEDLTKWNDSMNKGPIETAKANTASLSQFITDSAAALSGITTPITDTLTWLGESAIQWGVVAWDMITNFVGGLTGGLPDLDETLSTLETKIQDTINWLITLPGKAWQWGWDIIDSWKKGLGAALDGSKQWIEDKLSYLSGLLEGHSPPKEGPLSEIDQWGVNIGRSFVEGIGEGIGISSSILNSALSGISGGFAPGSFALPAAATSGLSTSGSTIPVTINLTLPAMKSREEAIEYGNAAGQAAGQSFAEVLRGQATNAGVSTINMMR